MTVASLRISRRTEATVPRRPIARLAKAVSSWKGLPSGEPAETVMMLERNRCLTKEAIRLPVTLDLTIE